MNDRALRGEFSLSLVYILKGLFDTLELSTENRNLGPVPPRILEDTRLTMTGPVGGAATIFDDWVHLFVKPVSEEEAATTGEVVASLLSVATGVQKGMARSQMVAAGFLETRKNTKRFFMKVFKDPHPGIVQTLDYTKPIAVGLDATARMPGGADESP